MAEATQACRLAVMGDSLTAGYELALEDAFPAQLDRYLRQNGVQCEVENHGISGDTSAGGKARMDWVLGGKPTHMILALGANDGLRALPVEAMQNNLETIISRALDESIRVFLIGMLAPPNLGDDYGSAFKSAFRSLARQFDLPLYPFFMAGVIGQQELLLDDAMHPNPKGVARMVEGVGPQVRDWIVAPG